MNARSERRGRPSARHLQNNQLGILRGVIELGETVRDLQWLASSKTFVRIEHSFFVIGLTIRSLFGTGSSSSSRGRISKAGPILGIAEIE